MPDGFTPLRNSFHATLLGLEHPPGNDVDIFSQACVEAYAASSSAEFGYAFTQVFEPAVLHELSLLEGIPYASVAELGHQPTAALRRLAELARQPGELSLVELVNTAAALISISRFALASALLDTATERASTPQERFEIAWLRFLVTNRRDDGKSSPREFAVMRQEITTGQIPNGRVLDTCTQAVVWHLKRREVPEELFIWAVRTGQSLVGKSGNRIDSGTVSSWFRGIAMLPAARGRASQTRRYMEHARTAAEEAIADNPGAVEKNAIKTYYESWLKERMYHSRDFDGAEEAGRKLIALDPIWAPSYGELAEVFEKSGRQEQAAELYEQAARLGPPYVGHHLMRAASCHVTLGQHERALKHYGVLAKLAPNNERVRNAALPLLDKVPPAMRRSAAELFAADIAPSPHTGEPTGGTQ